MSTLDDAVAELRRDPHHPVRARVDDLTVELRVVAQGNSSLSAAQLFAQIGPWGGETTAEILELLGDARRSGTCRQVREL